MPKTVVDDFGTLNAIGVVFDSGSSYMYCTQNDLEVLLNFVKQVDANPSCTITDSMIQCTCTSNTDLDTTFPGL
jgi:hypothetical protein